MAATVATFAARMAIIDISKVGPLRCAFDHASGKGGTQVRSCSWPFMSTPRQTFDATLARRRDRSPRASVLSCDNLPPTGECHDPEIEQIPSGRDLRDARGWRIGKFCASR